MKNADKNKDPERAVKRAKTDARCAFRKLELLRPLETAVRRPDGNLFIARSVLLDIAEALGVEGIQR